MTGNKLVAREAITLDDRIRGVPPGTPELSSTALAGLGWHPAGGTMSLPVLTLDEDAFIANRDLFMRYVRDAGAEIAPHGKTPMAPDLAHALVDAGAWGTTVADIRQASVMLRAGLDRLILANEVGGAGGASRLAALVAAWPQAEIYVFADSPAVVEALATEWRRDPSLPPLRVLVETGSARAGSRTIGEAEAIADAIVAAGGRLIAAGVGTYEGAAAQPDAARTEAVISELLARTGDMLLRLRARLGPDAPLIATAGGSVFFDMVVGILGPVAREARAPLVLRSGALFFHDHGVYDRGMAAMDARHGFVIDDQEIAARQAFRPTMRIWAEVLSLPEPGLAICGMGMRDVAFDTGHAVPVALHRGGEKLGDDITGARITKLNDQHAYLALAEGAPTPRVGDVVEFGISHPCTQFDRYRVIFGIGPDGRVRNAFPTYFG